MVRQSLLNAIKHMMRSSEEDSLAPQHHGWFLTWEHCFLQAGVSCESCQHLSLPVWASISLAAKCVLVYVFCWAKNQGRQRFWYSSLCSLISINPVAIVVLSWTEPINRSRRRAQESCRESAFSVVRCDSDHTGPENQARRTHPH